MVTSCPQIRSTIGRRRSSLRCHRILNHYIKLFPITSKKTYFIINPKLIRHKHAKNRNHITLNFNNSKLRFDWMHHKNCCEEAPLRNSINSSFFLTRKKCLHKRLDVGSKNVSVAICKPKATLIGVELSFIKNPKKNY